MEVPRRLSSPWCHRHHRPIGGVAQGKHIDGGKMCDGWPAGPAPSRVYSTPIGTNSDPYPALLLLRGPYVAAAPRLRLLEKSLDTPAVDIGARATDRLVSVK